MSVKVESRRCPQDHPCPAIRVCPVGALKQGGHAAPVVNDEACIDCGKCSATCPYGVFQEASL